MGRGRLEERRLLPVGSEQAEDIPHREKGNDQRCWVLLHRAAGACGAVAAEPTALCVAGGGRHLCLAPGLRLGWAIPCWDLANPL